MCGIFITEGTGTEPFVRAENVLHRMKYRGPDLTQIDQISGLTLGLARLAIVRKKEGYQPHHTKQGRVVLLNGELYNYRDLGAHDTQSEVEYLGEALDAGVDPRLFFDGDYAIAYYDPTWKQLVLYRDRFGVVPLYYQLRPKIEVSSERRRLEHPIELRAGERLVIDVARGVVGGRDVLPIATGMTASGGDIEVQASVARSLMRDAISSRVRHSDNRISIALSGGLDSTLIAYLLQDTTKVEELITVTMDAESAEAKAATLTAMRTSWLYRHRLIVVTPEQIKVEAPAILTHLLDGAPPTSAHLSPLRWTGAVRLWFAAKACRTKVLIGGDGPDEMLGGYPSHFRDSDHQLDIARKCETSLRSMANFNLDRANKMTMAHSVEYRPPYLSHTLANYLLSLRRERGKPLLRHMLSMMTCEQEDHRPKYYDDDMQFANTFPKELAA